MDIFLSESKLTFGPQALPKCMEVFDPIRLNSVFINKPLLHSTERVFTPCLHREAKTLDRPWKQLGRPGAFA